jgi:hypothetical protein
MYNASVVGSRLERLFKVEENFFFKTHQATRGVVTHNRKIGSRIFTVAINVVGIKGIPDA